MSAELLTNISAALSQTFAPKLARQWNRRAVTAKNLKVTAAPQFGIGKNVGWDVLFSGATAASFVEGADVSTYNQDVPVPATLAWGQYQSAFSMSNLEINAAAASMGNAEALGNMVVERIENAMAKIISTVNADIFAGTGTDGSGNPTIFGFGTAMLNSGNYAGVNASTYTEWVGNVAGNSGTNRPLTLDLLAGLEAQIFTAYGTPPTMLVCSPGIYQKYEGLFNSVLRTNMDGRGPMTYGAGSAEMFWRGIPVIRDRNCQANTLYMVNQDHVELVTLPWANVPDGVMTREGSMKSSSGDDMDEPTGLGCMIYPLARTGSAVKFAVELYIQLKANRRNAHGILKDIAE